MGQIYCNRGYDTNDIVDFAIANGIEPVIPPKRNRIEQRDYDHYLYKLRHLVENAFLHLKRWRGYSNSLHRFMVRRFGITRLNTV